MIDYKVSTITMSMRIPNCKLNLINIGKYLIIDNEILGIKYNYGETSILKGKYSTAIYNKSKVKNDKKINKQLFYNQVTIIVKNNENNNINVKIFGNGSLHLTGVKDTNDGKKTLLLIYKKLMELINKYHSILIIKDVNNVYIDNNNMVYGNIDNKIVGYKTSKDSLYIINKKEYTTINIKDVKYFISNKLEAKRTKSILNLNGDYVGKSQIELVKNKSKLYKNNSNIYLDDKFIYYDNGQEAIIIANIVYTFDTLSVPQKIECKDSIIELNYCCNPFNNNETLDLNVSDDFNESVNCINIFFKLPFQLNRERLYKQLIINNLNCEYKPEYSGVKFIYKKNELDNGICLCNNKCTCKNITFLIFQTGNIIVSGFKAINQIDSALAFFEQFILKIQNIIIKKQIL